MCAPVYSTGVFDVYAVHGMTRVVCRVPMLVSVSDSHAPATDTRSTGLERVTHETYLVHNVLRFVYAMENLRDGDTRYDTNTDRTDDVTSVFWYVPRQHLSARGLADDAASSRTMPLGRRNWVGTDRAPRA